MIFSSGTAAAAVAFYILYVGVREKERERGFQLI
jgi:hypothetical protein